jgi:hypothetical protein
MTENAPPPNDESFAPDQSVESAGISSDSESNNVSRAAALATLLDSSRTAAAQLFDPLRELGFSDRTVETIGFSRERQFAPYSWLLEAGLPSSASDNRMQSWTDLNENADPTAAERFLLALLGSPLERESAAAAAVLVNLLPVPSPAARATWRRYWPFRSPADPILLEMLQTPLVLWPTDLLDADVEEANQASIDWDGQEWNGIFESTSSALREPETQMYQVRLLVAARLRAASRSADPITRSLAFAAQLGTAAGSARPTLRQAGPSTPPGALVISTMIHGTFGWKGKWWRPGGDFHEYMRGYRSNLYRRGARFSWSGAYSAHQRAVAAADFVDWSREVAPHGLQTLFTHSYGGDVAAQAALAGVTVNELVLLSSPGTDLVNDAVALGMRVVDVRLPFDPVLAIARTPQRLQPAQNITKVRLRWSLDHSASHKVKVWKDQSVATKAGIKLPQ